MEWSDQEIRRVARAIADVCRAKRWSLDAESFWGALEHIEPAYLIATIGGWAARNPREES